ncbi:MAG: carboxymuconolactone decarboxylase family protein [Terriglobia bacterium]
MQDHLASSKRAGLTREDWRHLKDPAAAPFTEGEKAALTFAEKLTRTPWKIGDGDVAELKKYFSDKEIVDLDLTVAMANLTTRFTAPMGLELERPPEQF